MNIFYLDPDPTVCAEYHNSKHVVKMILEYCQLLSTSHRVIDGTEVATKSKTGRNKKIWRLNDERDQILYSATHINHPSAIWCRTTHSNYNWLHSLLVELCAEYTFRYGKTHKCQESGLVDALKSCPINIPNGEFTGPTTAMPDDVKILGNSLESYRNYYIKNKTKLASWSGKVNSRTIPNWYMEK